MELCKFIFQINIYILILLLICYINNIFNNMLNYNILFTKPVNFCKNKFTYVPFKQNFKI